ncbi:MAG: zeta toxin family protein [Oscillospiraceae bacterium]|nr:zeta toxin family protein [Oscillospiraceae bacterium]
MKNPEIIVFAGPNGSGKSTITELANIIEPYINADNIKKSNYCTDMEAAVKAEEMRNNLINQCKSFTFETVLSTDRNIKLLRRAKENGYFIRCIYVLTADPNINIIRVKARTAAGGHDVPKEKILSRYKKALDLIPDLLEICDVCHIYDNSFEPFRIFKKRKTEYFYWENDFWNKSNISELTNIEFK